MDLNRIAGNTISVPTVGVIMSVLLACTKWRASRVLPHPERPFLVDAPQFQWLGQHRVSASGTAWDILAGKADKDGQPKKRRESSAQSARGPKKNQRKLEFYCK